MLPKETEFKLNLTAAASEQAKLILKNDFTLEDEVFRLKVDGKGCDGFDYALGFNEPLEDDVIINYPGLQLSMDPFTAHYCKEGLLDYLFDPESDQDGFIFINENQDQYVGKFFKDESMLPPLEENK